MIKTDIIYLTAKQATSLFVDFNYCKDYNKLIGKFLCIRINFEDQFHIVDNINTLLSPDLSQARIYNIIESFDMDDDNYDSIDICPDCQYTFDVGKNLEECPCCFYRFRPFEWIPINKCHVFVNTYPIKEPLCVNCILSKEGDENTMNIVKCSKLNLVYEG